MHTPPQITVALCMGKARVSTSQPLDCSPPPISIFGRITTYLHTCDISFQTSLPEDHIYTRGCVEGFLEWVETNIIMIGAIALGIALVQVRLSHLNYPR